MVSIVSKSFVLFFVYHIDGISTFTSSSSFWLSNDAEKSTSSPWKDMHLNRLTLRGGGKAEAESPRASHLGPDDALNQPIPKADIDFRIRARKKMTNKAGKQLKRRWIGGEPIPKAQLRQEEASRRAEKNAAYARFDHQEDGRLPTAKVDIQTSRSCKPSNTTGVWPTRVPEACAKGDTTGPSSAARRA